MQRQIFKFISIFVIVISLFFSNVSFAQPTVNSLCSESALASLKDNPNPLAIVCPFVRILNAMVLLSGAILVIMILYGAIKAAMSVGDPKGYQGAYLTWFWAVVGFAIIVGFFSIISIIANMLGYNIPLTPNSLMDIVLRYLYELLTALGVSNIG